MTTDTSTAGAALTDASSAPAAAPYVCLMGAEPYCSNRGVTALSSALVKNVLAVWPGARLGLFMGHQREDRQHVTILGGDVEIEMLNFRLSPRAGFRKHLLYLLLLAAIYRLSPSRALRQWVLRRHRILSRLAEASVVADIRGGDSFSDIYGFRSFIIGCLAYWVPFWLGKELILLPQTYGPFRFKAAAWMGGRVLRRAARVCCRDHKSVSIARDLRGEKSDPAAVRFCPDVAFTLDAIAPPGLQFDFKARRPLVGLNISGLLYDSQRARLNAFGLGFHYPGFVHNLVRRLLKETDATILLVPHTFGTPGGIQGDIQAIRQFLGETESRGQRIAFIDREYSASELKWIIGQCDFFIGSRMHACIAAISQGVPAAGVAYSRKFAGVFESVGLEQLVVDACRLSEEEAIQSVVDSYHRRAEVRARILPRVEEAQRLVRRTFEELLAPRGAQGQPAARPG